MTLASSFYLFVTSVTLGAVATVFVRFGVSWHLLQQTGSPAIVALVIGGSAVLEIYAKPLLAPLADHFDRFRIFRLCVLASTALGLLLALAMALAPASVALLGLCVAGLSLSAALRDPTSAAITPSLVSAGQLSDAQSMRSTANSLVAIGAPMAAGAAVTFAGTAATLGGAALLTALALVAALRVPRPPTVSAESGGWAVYRRSWHLRTLEGLRSAWCNRAERNIAFASALLNVGIFSFAALVLPVFVARTLHAPPVVMAAIELSFGVGLLVGSVRLTGWLNAALGRYAALVGATVVIAGAFGAAAWLSAVPALCACLALAGVGVSVFFINTTTLRAAATPPEFRARMVAGASFLSCCLHPLTAPVFGFLMERADARFAVALCGVSVLAAAAVLLANADARRLLGQPSERILGQYRQLYPHAYPEPAERAGA